MSKETKNSKTKSIRRFETTYSLSSKLFSRSTSSGYFSGIKNAEISHSLGYFFGTWGHLEEVMIFFMSDLIKGSKGARQIFRAIQNQQTRITVMKALLEASPDNREKDSEYDEILDEFSNLNIERNRLAHWLWHTEAHSMRVFIEKPATEAAKSDFIEITKNKMNNYTKRVLSLTIQIVTLRERRSKRLRKSRKINS